jgi:hyaluronoglucosaminidase
MTLLKLRSRSALICITFVLLLSIFSFPGFSTKAYGSINNTPPVVQPTPQSIKVTGNGFPLGPVGIVSGEGTDKAAVREVENSLKAFGVKTIIHFSDNEKSTAPVTVFVGGPNENAASSQILQSMGVKGTDGLPSEGYVMVSGHAKGEGKNIVLAGKDATGTFYASKSFSQLIETHSGNAWMPEVEVRDFPKMPIRGVIEGFYGTPWTHEARLNQLQFYGDHKMNTYVYAPKDDPYHRDKWRLPYPQEDLKRLGSLVGAAKEQHVNFVFTISPGLDVCYSKESELKLLIDKAQAMYDLGVRDFAILLDDIFQNMNCQEDEELFGDSESPFASAHAYLLNKFNEQFVRKHGDINRLITVPTEYYQAGTSPYRKTFADQVNPDILVYWTGIGIASKQITEADADSISKIFKHDLLVWDNYPVNDYARSRLFLAPLSNRGKNLTDNGVAGLTANPMEEAEASKISLYTVADYTWNPEAYDPQKSWENSLREFGGSGYGPLRKFAENTVSSPMDSEESPVLKQKISAFWEAFDQGEGKTEVEALQAEFQAIEDAPSELRNTLENRAFLEETRAWLDKTAYYGKTGKIAVQMLESQLKGDKENTAKYRAELDRAVKNDTTTLTIPENRQALRKLDGINKARGAAELIQYTPEFGQRTGTNIWGYEITVVDGRVISVGGNNSVIPENGYVLSVHSGGDGKWLENNSLVGARVEIKDQVVTIYIDKGEYTVPNLKEMGSGVMRAFINKAIKTNDLWLGKREGAGPFSTLGAWSEYTLEKMTDGDPSTLYWTNSGPKAGDYIGVDLGVVKKVQKIDLLMASTTGPVARPNDYIYNGSLEVSMDGTKWTKLSEYMNQAEIHFESTEAIDGRFVRFRVTADQTSWAQIREFTVTAN